VVLTKEVSGNGAAVGILQEDESLC